MVLGLKCLSGSAVVHVVVFHFYSLLLPPPRRVLCQKRPKKIFVLLSLMISFLSFPFVLAGVPLRQQGLNPQLPACIRVSTVQNSGSYFVPLQFPSHNILIPFL